MGRDSHSHQCALCTVFLSYMHENKRSMVGRNCFEGSPSVKYISCFDDTDNDIFLDNNHEDDEFILLLGKVIIDGYCCASLEAAAIILTFSPLLVLLPLGPHNQQHHSHLEYRK
jgi:hypothetical protein